MSLTKEDFMNIRKWMTATSMMIEARMRTPYSDSETATGDKLKQMEQEAEEAET